MKAYAGEMKDEEIATERWENEGVDEFNEAFNKLLETLAKRSPRHLTREQ